MLTRLMVKNFKSIGEPGIDIELRPLTIFVGPNGGGKSSILEALAFLAQNSRNDTVNLSHPGELIQYPDISAIAHRGQQSKSISIGLFSSKAPLGFRFSVRPDTLEATEDFLREDGSHVLGMRLTGDRRLGYEIQLIGTAATSHRFKVDFMRILNSDYLRQMGSATQYSDKEMLDNVLPNLDALATELVGKVFLISGLRGDIPSQLSTGSDAAWVGKKCEGLLIILTRVGSPAYEDVNKQIQEWASKFELKKVWAGIAGSNALSGEYRDPVLQTNLNLNLASQGSRQALGMIVQLFWAKPGSIVMIEEPELSLHPEAQDKLPPLFADAVKDGKQVMITTHSHYLLLALTEAVKAGLPAEDIAVYEVKKEPETGTTAKRLPVTKEGYIKGWVSSFSQADKELFSRRSVRTTTKRVKQ